ncbi:MAG: hydantoinase/oxoprolinase family protein [Thermodesulfobacteriota bacterium]
MGFTMDIDTGGTFTDGFFASGGQVERVKVDTTPHDFTLCFLNCLAEGAKRFGISTEELLRQTEVVRLATTVGSNTLITRSGPKLGLIVTRGFEKNLYGDEARPPLFDFIISPSMVIGLDEEVDSAGRSVKAPDEKDVKLGVKRLLEMGSRIIVVCLANGGWNDAHERAVKQTIRHDYPRHYLGAVPILLASEISRITDDALRVNTAAVNAYLHRRMARFLYRADEEIGKMWYQKPLLVAHTSGGVARVAKTTAVETLDSGPACGVAGTAFMSRLYGLDKTASIDIGGTSTDIGLVLDGNYSLDYYPVQSGVPIYTPSIELKTIGGGGGSIAKPIPESRTIQMGPESAGASPGPACYDLGGFEATATDACVVLGYIDPDYFLGGRRRLTPERAWEAVESNVASVLGMKVEEAAYQMAKGIEAIGFSSLRNEITRRDLDPRGFSLFAFGGAGGLFAAGIGAALGVARVISFSVSPVFSAFGSSTLDVSHHYDSSDQVPLLTDGSINPEAAGRFTGIVEQLQKAARRDMRGEGFATENISFSLELNLNGCHGRRRVISPVIQAQTESDLAGIVRLYEQPAGGKNGTVQIESFRLSASAAIPHFVFASHPMSGPNPDQALKGERKAYWDGGFRTTKIFDRELMASGNVISGPAIIESADTVLLIPPGSAATMDNFLNIVIQRA